MRAAPKPRGAEDMDPGHATYRFPASSGQHRFWVLGELAAPGAADPFVIRSGVRIEGPVCAATVQRALDAVVQQHDGLRTGLVFDGGRLLQHVRETVPIVLGRCEATGPSGVAEQRRNAALAQLSESFDLVRPPLLRATLIRFGSELHELHVAVHHSVCDGWSLAVVLEDLVSAYEVLRRGERLPEPAAIQFPDYVAWQQEQLTPQRLAQGLCAFREDLLGVLPLPLPVDRAGRAADDPRGLSREHVLDASTWAALKARATDLGTTPFTLTTTAFGIALARLSGSADLCLGVAVSGRARQETRRMVGLLMNTLPVRLRFDLLPDRATLEEAMTDGTRTVTEVLARQEVPYAEIQRAATASSQADRNTSLFRAMCLYQELPVPEAHLSGLRITPIDDGVRTVRSDLALVVRPGAADTCHLTLEYATALIDTDTAQCWLDLLVGVLTAVATDLSLHWRDLGVADGASPVTALAPTVSSAWQQFQNRAQHTPDRVAVESWEHGELSRPPTRTTYAELRARVEPVRERLRATGLGHGHRLGVQLPRDRELVTALLACLAEGITYVPLDPAVPEARRRQMIDTADVCAVLEPDEDSTGLHLVRAHDCTAICSTPDLGPDGIAYVIFTSGSTGVPKGVQVSRGSLDVALDWMRHVSGIEVASRWAAVSSSGFDISLVELLCPLLASAVTLVVPAEVGGDGPLLDALLREHKVSVVQATPSTWQLLRRAGARLDPGLRVLSGGEPLPESAASWLAIDGSPVGRRVTNLYGPTEATIWVSASDVDGHGPVTLGELVPGASWSVLDETLRPVPVGAVGELYLSGAQLAKGYQAGPRETADVFLPGPGHVGSRMYRTGDRVRVLPDRRLCYVGRDDDQVKIRGHRIELREIESLLTGHPDVLEAAAFVVRHGEDDVRLTAAVVLAGPSTGAVDALRELMVRHLPAPVVPRIVVVDRLPRTTAGKLDRGALNLVSPTTAAQVASTPESALETTLCAMFSELLDLEVGSTDLSFFDLGGHSLLAASLLHRIEDELGVAIPLRRFFDSPSVAALVVYLEPRMSGGADRDRQEFGALEQLDEEVLDRMLARLEAPTHERSTTR